MFFFKKKKKKSAYTHLRDKWLETYGQLQHDLSEKHAHHIEDVIHTTRNVATGSLGGLMMLSATAIPQIPVPHVNIPKDASLMDISSNVFLTSDLFSVLPKKVEPLTAEEEKKVEAILSRDFGIKVAAELEGKRLNRNYGFIGAEQHLARYPGDTMYSHFDAAEEQAHFAKSGMAPGLGAWGHFASSKNEMTEKDKMREKYYIAVPTFLAPGFRQNVSEYYTFFKYRKMLVVNPQSGKAVVAVIADAGPAVWTGKHLGGSPEVMHYLERVDGKRKGAVLYFFVDDPEDKVALGPIKTQE